MKSIEPENIHTLPGRPIKPGETFTFGCHAQLTCFNRCCRNLNLFLYPYDVARLRKSLGISSDEFIERYVDVVLRKGSHFPEVLLRMADNSERTCPFLTPQGCRVYPDRPDTCRNFPVEQGMCFNADGSPGRRLFLLRPPDFCLGTGENRRWTPESWTREHQTRVYYQMTVRWAQILRLFEQDPWGAEGPEGPRAKMAFMAAYNIDRFRQFVFQSSFLKRYRVKPDRVRKMRADDRALLEFGFEWIAFFIRGVPSRMIRPR
jgi:Fe-S-cluster containining protein